MVRRRQTRHELARAVVPNCIVVVTREYINKIPTEQEAKDLDTRASPFKIFPCATTISGDLMQMWYVPTIVTFGCKLLAVVLRNMSK